MAIGLAAARAYPPSSKASGTRDLAFRSRERWEVARVELLGGLPFWLYALLRRAFVRRLRA